MGKTKASKKRVYEVTSTGRLTISDFAELTGQGTGTSFVLQRPKGRIRTWRLAPSK